MNLEKVVRNLIIGKNRYIDSFSEYRQVILSGRLAMIAMAILFFNCLFEESFDWAVVTYLVSISVLALSIFLNRMARHELANYVLLITANFTTYLFASSESMQTGVCVFFVVISIGGFVLMNHRNQLQAIFFAILSFLFFYLSYFVDFRILPWRNYSDEQIFVIAIVNMSMAIVSSGMAVSFLLRLNSTSARQLSENNKLLVKTNTELDRFVYSASHDLRAPLSSLLGLINISKLAVKPEEVLYNLDMMEGRISHLDSFIKEIINYSRNSRLAVQAQHVNLLTLTNDVMDSLRFSEQAPLIKMDIQVSPNFQIYTDGNRLKVILTNLISNSIRYADFTKTNPFIRIIAARVEDKTSIQVTDNGQGIPKEHHDKIFDMFYRASENSKGSGLGLYIVMETLTRLGGSIETTSELGTGSTFTIFLPKGGNS